MAAGRRFDIEFLQKIKYCANTPPQNREQQRGWCLRIPNFCFRMVLTAFANDVRSVFNLLLKLCSHF